jgi:hypothetical protein
VYRTFLKQLRPLGTALGVKKYVPAELQRGFNETLRTKTLGPEAMKAIGGAAANIDDIAAFLGGSISPIRTPVVLISQAQRSGGTLLSQLLDGHPAIAAHPHELKIGYPTTEDWPDADPRLGAEGSFKRLFEARNIALLREGYTKGDKDPERHPFFLVPAVHYRLFRQLFHSAPPASSREVLDHYFASYFKAWLNYRGPEGAKRWISVFAPRLAHREASVARFFADYPDGRLIQIVRDPMTWLPSARAHGKKGVATLPIETLLETWRASGEAILRNRERYGDRVVVMRFEDLIGRTAGTMRALARELEIDYLAILAEPTFNGTPMRANSSFAVAGAGIIAAPLEREAMLSEAEQGLVDRLCRDLYERASGRALQPAA